MSSSEKDLVHEPPSSYGNHSTTTGDHDQPPKPEELAGPSKLHRQSIADIRLPAERSVMARSISGAASALGDDTGCRNRYAARKSKGKR